MAVPTSLATHLHGQLAVLPLSLRDLVLAKVVVESLDVALHTDPVLIQGSEILEIFATELAPTWAGQRSARESAAVIKQRVNPMLALEHA